MIVRLAQIGRMIINTRTSRTLLFFRTAQTLHIAIVVVRPYNRNIIRQFQSLVVYIQHLFIRSKGLRDIFATLTRRINQHLSLCHQCILEHLFSIRHIIARIHRSVMQSAQSQSVHILKRSTFIRTCSQHTVYSRSIVDVVPFAHLVTFPLACRVEQQRFAVRRPHHDGETICYQSILRYTMKCHRRIVHGRTQIICLKTEQ